MAMTAKRHALVLLAVPAVLLGFALWMGAQEDLSQNDLGEGPGVIRKVVDMVQLNVAVTDAKGNYVTNLKPTDFTINEDKIQQSLASFEEGNGAPRVIAGTPAAPAPAPQPSVASALREGTALDVAARTGAEQP